MSSAATVTCARCGNAASGNFCASCGAVLAGAHCTSCGVALAPGAAFCHACGAATSGAPRHIAPGAPVTAANQPVWIVAGLLVVVVIAAVVYSARGHSAPPPADMPNEGNAGLAAPVQAPDISNLTPKQQFTRLNDRVIAAADKGDTATVMRFWPMTVGAYQNLAETDRDVDTRYHMATLYLMVEQFPQTLALADTILRASPNNLFAFYLRGMVADFQGDSLKARAERAEFIKRYPTEIKKQQTEYLNNRPLLDAYYQKDGGK